MSRDTRRRVELCRAANERYLEALVVVGVPKASHGILDPVSRAVETPRRYPALCPISREDGRLLQVILRGEFQLQAVRNEDLQRHFGPADLSDAHLPRQLSSRVTLQLALPCAHGLIYRVLRTHYYRTTRKGQEVMITALKFRTSEVAVLAA